MSDDEPDLKTVKKLKVVERDYTRKELKRRKTYLDGNESMLKVKDDAQITDGLINFESASDLESIPDENPVKPVEEVQGVKNSPESAASARQPLENDSDDSLF